MAPYYTTVTHTVPSNQSEDLHFGLQSTIAAAGSQGKVQWDTMPSSKEILQQHNIRWETTIPYCHWPPEHHAVIHKPPVPSQ